MISCKNITDGYWDALMASALAGAYGCPVLITNGSELSSVTAAEIKRLGAETVLVCGGEFSVSDEVKAAVEALGVKAERLFGRTAADTAIEVAKAVAPVTPPAGQASRTGMQNSRYSGINNQSGRSL